MSDETQIQQMMANIRRLQSTIDGLEIDKQEKIKSGRKLTREIQKITAEQQELRNAQREIMIKLKPLLPDRA